MVYVTWRRWAQIFVWIHLIALVGNAGVYAYISFAKAVPFDTIFLYPETAPYYLTVYALVIVFTFSLCVIGLIFQTIFGYKDLRALIVSRGMLLVGSLGSLLPLTLITLWDQVLRHPHDPLWLSLANTAQHFGIWLTFVLVVTFSLVMLLLFFLGKEQAQIPNGWAFLCLVMALVGALVALSCFWISKEVIAFRILYLMGSMGYLVWGIWLAFLLRRIDHA